MNDKARILVASFGTSHLESYQKSILAIEQEIRDAFPVCETEGAFTSKVVIDLLKKKEGIEVLHLEEALQKAANDGIQTLYVQPTHFLKGNDYKRFEDILEGYRGEFSAIVIGEPLLSGEDDIEEVAETVYEAAKEYFDDDAGICFVGHGVDADLNLPYEKLQAVFDRKEYHNCFVGVLKGEPSKETVMHIIREKCDYQRIVLIPLMIAAGSHALTEMAGNNENSWKIYFQNAGYEVECVLNGLGECARIRKIFVEHVKHILEE